MNKTRIEWCDYTINPIKGLCPMHCKTPDGYEYCYAAGERGLYKRFKWNPKIRFDKEVPIYGFPTGSRVFIGSTIELFGDWVKEDWLKIILANVRQNPDVTFIFLTKQPQNLIKWSPFPDNVWVGLSVDGTENAPLSRIYNGLAKTQARVKFISFEPLLADPKLDYRDLEWAGISWVIIGQQTPIKKSTMPKIEWIDEIVDAADKTNTPVFLKDNLNDFIYGEYGGKYKQIFKYTQDGGRKLRQEFPKGV